jgi:hypothetical protein
VIGNRMMTFKTRIPSPAAFELEGDDIQFTVPMRAAGILIYVDTKNFISVNYTHRFFVAASLR